MFATVSTGPVNCNGVVQFGCYAPYTLRPGTQTTMRCSSSGRLEWQGPQPICEVAGI